MRPAARVPWPLIGGARLTNESAYAWAKLAKSVIGTDSVDAQLGDGLPAELVLGLPRATIDAACAAPVLITLAGDLREELPVLFLRLREAVIGSTELDRADAGPDRPEPPGHRHLAHPARRGAAGGPRPVRRRRGRDRLASHPQGPAIADDVLAAARASVAARPDGEGIVMVVGRPSYAESGEVVAEAAARPGGRPAQGDVPAGPAPGQRLRGPGHGAGARAPARAGQPGDRPGLVHRRLGLGARERRASIPPPSCPPWPASPPRVQPSPRWSCWGPTRMNDFPDRAVAEAALSAGHFMVAVTGHPSESVDAYADVVLPCAVAHERPGTSTNIEGRVSRLGPQADRARLRLGRLDDRGRAGGRARDRLGVSSANDLADEMQLTAPAYAGLTLDVLHSDAAHDGIVLPLVEGATRRRRGRADRPDGAARGRVGGATGRAAPHRPGRRGRPGRTAASPRRAPRPPLLSGVPGPGGDGAHVPPADNYALRLVATRRLYDAGVHRHRVALADAAGAQVDGPGQPLRPRPARAPTRGTRSGCARPAARWC